MKVNTLHKFLCVTVPPRKTVQECLLCSFPSDALTHLISVVRGQIDSQFRNHARKVSTSPEDLKMSVNPGVYVVLLQHKVGLLSLMTTCSALYFNTRRMLIGHAVTFLIVRVLYSQLGAILACIVFASILLQ